MAQSKAEQGEESGPSVNTEQVHSGMQGESNGKEVKNSKCR